MRLSSLILAAPGGDRAVTIAGPTSRIAGYQPAQLRDRFGGLFGRPDTTVVCELKGGRRVLQFDNVDRFVHHAFGDNEIVRIHAVPNLAWEEVKMKNPSLEVQNLLGQYKPSEFKPGTEPSPAPLDRDA